MDYRENQLRKGKAWVCWLTLIDIAAPAIMRAAAKTWIVFECNRPNPNSTEYTYWDIWKLDPDADNVNESDCDLYGDPLTADMCSEWDPTYSVEDKSVVFVSDKDGWPHLYKMSINGGAWKQLTSGNYSTVDPCYSFDGTKIAFTSNQSGQWHIYTMNTDGSEMKQITQGASDNRSPCFSTNGDKIYFLSNRDTDNSTVWGDWEIYRVNSGGGTAAKAIINGSGASYLMNWTEHDPCCSPTDPNIIVFASNYAHQCFQSNPEDCINFELFKYDFRYPNTPPVRLTESWNERSCDPTPCREMWNSSMPCFSPDGERIAWSADNWTGTGWLGDYSTRPYDDAIPTENIYDSYWKPLGLEQGSSHNIWIMDKDEDHHYWFPASYWGWDNGLTIYKHHHHKNYNPSWDEQP
ncbi:DUF5050 domain-containing protein [bacterium]|nr:DUF5050 domain-containing protein [bacterium]